ncbi:6-phosphogluconolactonase [Sporomusa sp.]|uniref:6-phosphogluconolactonase n=1 Tax=Sporomusa sp. TaxID=2078658 RepID=UPI002D18027E|nr:6-phosphogluconolactonase [Sporomusa sp.]HWR07253.1 6-phosphogluconolactonase [Sporomusa sp.]
MEIRGRQGHRVIIADTPQAVWQKAAELFTLSAAHAIAARGRFTTALAGGTTPQVLYELLAADKYRQIISWEKVFIFWGDERCVPPGHADSNYRMIADTLLSKVPIPASNIFKMYLGDEQPAAAAAAYEHTLMQFFGLNSDEKPCFDLILLGLGHDGHTASLFPGSAAVNEENALVSAAYVSTLASYRLTLTLPVLNAAARVVFLVTGDSKASVLYDLVADPDKCGIIPAKLVRPAGELLVLSDKQAAKYLLN